MTNLEKMKKIRKKIIALNESDAKSVLMLTAANIYRVNSGNGSFTSDNCIDDLIRLYNSIPEPQANIEKNTHYKTIHIVFSDSPAGSLKNVLKEMGLQDEEKVITFSDIFSVGPVWHLHEKTGLNNRYEWLKKHINIDDEVLDSYQDKFNNTVSEINAIPIDTPIIIWIGENAHEQTALRYVLYLLKEKTNDIFVMDTTSKYKNQFDVPEAEFFPLHTGEISPDKLRLLYEKNGKGDSLTQNERKKFEKEWERLSTKQEVLRIWKNKMINSVNESYYDDYIIDTIRKIHIERKNNEFVKSARLIGEVMGHLNQYIGDQFFEYRVRHLIVNGIFEIEGVPKAMRYYSIRLR
ncbi:DUF1835 domain-containing protein [Aminipila sp.]|uniref:DUF1835 domain-containing protein n=1 Tax=Aminipila sp. TaxID=2060095 RepID=UPI0028A2746A|nr:DUF1835 domain-containing protein [Aminipila sp.]